MTCKNTNIYATQQVTNNTNMKIIYHDFLHCSYLL